MPAKPDSPTYDIFVSHSHENILWVKRAAFQWRELGLKVCVDDDDFRYGDRILMAIENAIENSRFVVLVLSNQAIQSHWVKFEYDLRMFSNQIRNETRSLIPIFIESIDPEDVPLGIRNMVSVDLTGDNRTERYHKFLRQLGVAREILPDPPMDNYSLPSDDIFMPYTSVVPPALTPESDSKYGTIIAIDFGSSHSGYSYATREEPEIFIRDKWPKQPRPYVKTLTALLFNPYGKVAHFGYEARNEYARLRREGKATNYRYYEDFKRSLKNGDVSSEGPVQAAPDGIFRPVMGLITDYLREMKQFANRQLQLLRGDAFNDRDVRWCLTVPAVWNEIDKNQMRNAAVAAEMISRSSKDAQRLLLVLEPEAAALYCMEYVRRNHGKEIDKGTKIAVIDAGGGTVDITFHQVGTDGAMEELMPGIGGLLGSMYVDDEFVSFLQAKIGHDVFDELRIVDPLAHLTLLKDWEERKCDVADDDTVIYVPIPRSLHILLQRPKYADRFKAFVDSQQGEDNYICIPNHEFRRMFKRCIDGIINLAMTALKSTEMEGTRYVFLVGGFAESLFLQQQLRIAIQGIGKASNYSSPHLIIPAEPCRAVLWGAAAYGRDPSRIRVRVARYTYGCEVVAPFDEEVDREDRAKVNPMTGCKECRGRFHLLIRGGQKVPFGDSVTQILVPYRKSQPRASFRIYRSSQEDPRYIDDPGVEFVKELQLKLPNEDVGADHRIKLLVGFGGTELSVQATDVRTGNAVETIVNFDSTFYREEVLVGRDEELFMPSAGKSNGN